MKKEFLVKEYLFENDGDFFESFFENKLDAVRATFYGDYKFNDDYVRFNGMEI